MCRAELLPPAQPQPPPFEPRSGLRNGFRLQMGLTYTDLHERGFVRSIFFGDDPMPDPRQGLLVPAFPEPLPPARARRLERWARRGGSRAFV